MNKYLKIGIVELLSLCLYACEGGTEGLPDYQKGTVPIGFAPNVETQTRGTDYTGTNLPSFGVFAYFTQGSSFNTSTSTPNYLCNEKVYKPGGTGSWTYDNTRYWPVNSADKVSFFAYASHSPSGLTVPVTTAQGYPSFTYQIPETEADQTDLLLAKPVPDRTVENGTVDFAFRHVMTRVILNIEAGEGFTDVTINSLSIKTKKQGTVAFTSTTHATDWFQWSNIASGTENDVTCTATLSSPTVTAGTTQKAATFFLLPVAAMGVAPEKAKLSVNYTLNGNVQETKTVNDLEMESMDNWLPGTSITYKLKLTRDEVTVAVSSIEVWNGSSIDIAQGGEIEEGYKAEDVKLGDYYYDDGTYSDGGYRLLIDGTELQYNIDPIAGKNCIGIVYANGQTGITHEDNISNYSGTGLNGATEIKGYVMGHGRSRGYRNGDGSSSTTAFNGYTNTLSLSTGDNELRTLAVNTAAPDQSSDWYVMSFAQTDWTYQKRNIINVSRARVGQGDMNCGETWTSTTNGNFGMSYDNGLSGGRHKTDLRYAHFGLTF